MTIETFGLSILWAVYPPVVTVLICLWFQASGGTKK
jgi:hypothetical protein